MAKKTLGVNYPPFQSFILLFLRVASACLLLTHGFPKFQKLISGAEIHFGNPIGLGEKPSFILVMLAEFVCSILVALGFVTRWACIPIIFTMLIVVFVAHSGHPIGERELPIAYALLFIFIATFGPGKYSLDALRK